MATLDRRSLTGDLEEDLTPAEFTKRMAIVCRQSKTDLVIRDGMTLISDALGPGAHLYLPGVNAFNDRVRELVKRECGIGGTSD